MFNVIDNNNKLEMQMGKLSKRKCIYNSTSKCLCISENTEVGRTIEGQINPPRTELPHVSLRRRNPHITIFVFIFGFTAVVGFIPPTCCRPNSI